MKDLKLFRGRIKCKDKLSGEWHYHKVFPKGMICDHCGRVRTPKVLDVRLKNEKLN